VVLCPALVLLCLLAPASPGFVPSKYLLPLEELRVVLFAERASLFRGKGRAAAAVAYISSARTPWFWFETASVAEGAFDSEGSMLAGLMRILSAGWLVHAALHRRARVWIITNRSTPL
jgi:hypothetical protein